MSLPEIKTRPVDETRVALALDCGLPPVAARIVGARPLPHDEVAALLSARLSALDSYAGLPDIGIAATRLSRAIQAGEVIALETDHDVDGVTSHAVLWRALVEKFGVPAERVQSYIGHRLKEGYGLSAPVADRILAANPRPTVVITADNGSSDEARIARLKARGIEVIVTDHHELPAEGPPASALACVSPARPDSVYPDPCIAGCMVSFLLVCAVRAELVAAGVLAPDAGRMLDLLDYVAVGTVADCVSLARSTNNRAVVRAGLRLINGDTRPCWRAARAWLHGRSAVTAEDLAFGIGPRINARGRLDEAMAGVHFLLAETGEEAATLAQLLDDENQARKDIEHRLREDAVTLAAALVEAGARGIVVWLPDGHAGVHGIVASRVVEAFGRPVVCLSPKMGDADLVTGSARGIPGVHVRDLLQSCADVLGTEVTAFGGHAGAGGITLRREAIERFREAFDAAASATLTGRTLGPVIWTDGTLAPEVIDLATVDALADLDPYGREFESPLFEGVFGVLAVKPVGDGTHLKLTLDADGRQVEGIWFRARADSAAPLPVLPGQAARLVYRLAANVWNGRRSVQIIVEHCRPG